MSSDPSVLIQLAQLNESKKDWAAALDCLERAASSGQAPVIARVVEAAKRIAEAASPRHRERARALATGRPPPPAAPVEPGPERPSTRKLRAAPPVFQKGAADAAPPSAPPPAPPPAAPAKASQVSTSELEAARSLLVTPDVVRALREALGGAAPAEAPPSLPVEAILARLLACELDLAPVIDLSLDLVLEATGAARGFMLVKDEKGRLELSRGRGLGRADLPAELSTSILAEAERTGEPVFIGDAATDARFGQRQSVIRLGLRSVACVPIVEPSSKELLGVVYVDDPHASERFGPRSRELVRALARAVAIPLRNARRFEAQKLALGRSRAAATGSAPTGVEAPGAARIVGRSACARELLDRLTKVAREDVPVLIEGESGTGKELAARFIHEHSARAKAPFVAENLGALSPTLIEAELFGVVKGAYTGADRDRDGLFVRAQGGTVFLDEIGELPIEAQAKLLRVLQEREVRPLGGERVSKIDARVLAATNRDLGDMARDGSFREDLLYRLRVLTVRVPSLRERSEDVPLLAEHILERISEERGEPVTPLSRAALAKLAARPWRGNVRELENVLWRVALAGEGAIDEPGAVSAEENEGGLRVKIDLDGEPLALDEARVALDRAYIRLVLERNQGNIAGAARALGVARPALSRILKRIGLRT